MYSFVRYKKGKEMNSTRHTIKHLNPLLDPEHRPKLLGLFKQTSHSPEQYINDILSIVICEVVLKGHM